jgi:hypothetical protein
MRQQDRRLARQIRLYGRLSGPGLAVAVTVEWPREDWTYRIVKIHFRMGRRCSWQNRHRQPEDQVSDNEALTISSHSY